MVIRAHLDKELQELHYSILAMGGLTEEAIDKAIRSLVKQDVELAEKVIENDDVIDKMEIDIVDKCIKLIATQQPIGKDLRIIFTSSRIVTDLERIADHAVDIAKATKRLANEKYIKPLIDIPRMAEIVRQMIKESLDAYINEDINLAEETCKKDDIVDALYKQIFRELLTFMMEDPRTISQATQFLFICRYLERVADHATNICEWVIYRVTGERKDLNI